MLSSSAAHAGSGSWLGILGPSGHTPRTGSSLANCRWNSPASQCREVLSSEHRGSPGTPDSAFSARLAATPGRTHPLTVAGLSKGRQTNTLRAPRQDVREDTSWLWSWPSGSQAGEDLSSMSVPLDPSLHDITQQPPQCRIPMWGPDTFHGTLEMPSPEMLVEFLQQSCAEIIIPPFYLQGN